LSIDNLWVYVAINLVCFAVAWPVARGDRFYRAHLSALSVGRYQMLDGLRGWLAIGVFVSHVADSYFFYKEGEYGSLAAPFLTMTGDVGVSLFFMITGFLFWGRVLRSKGTFDVQAFFVSRLRRIVPMYLVSVLMVLAVVALLSGFSLRVDLHNLVRELRPWFSFGFIRPGDVNGVKDAYSINAVYWTLAYEWLFYLSLPLLALFAKGRWSLLLLCIAFVFSVRDPVVPNFIFGALAAVSVEKKILGPEMARPWMTPVPLLALAGAFLFPFGYTLGAEILLFFFFLSVVHGNSLFGVLSSRTAHLLGTISYSLYLTHSIVLFVVLRIVNHYSPIIAMDPRQYLAFAALAAGLSVLVSVVTYRYIEHPFLASKGSWLMKNRAPADPVQVPPSTPNVATLRPMTFPVGNSGSGEKALTKRG
jgi:peptidoglycan/LPS O-acetylase OafA/YrhL